MNRKAVCNIYLSDLFQHFKLMSNELESLQISWSTFMVSEKKKVRRNKKEKQNQWHNNDNINKRQNTLKKATVYLLEGLFWLKCGELLKVLYFGPLCQCLGLNQGHFYLRYHTLFFPKITIILSIVKDTILSIIYAWHYINIWAIDLRVCELCGHMQAIPNHETRNI